MSKPCQKCKRPTTAPSGVCGRHRLAAVIYQAMAEDQARRAKESE